MKEKIDKPGIYTVPADVYHADDLCPAPSLSSSVAEILLSRSPWHAWTAHPRLNTAHVPEEKAAFDRGSAAHALLLEGEDRCCIVPFDNYKTKAAQELRDAARANGQHPVLEREYADILAMRERAVVAVSQCADLSGLQFGDGEAEQTIIWREGDVWLRSRLDWLSTDRAVILDYKSTTDATPAAFQRQIARMNYHFQEAFYRRAVRAIHGDDPKFVFLAQENKAPYDCSFHGCAPSMQEIADAAVELAIGTWRECVTADKWPGYSNRIHWAEATTWQTEEHYARMGENTANEPLTRGQVADALAYFKGMQP